jgi:hypothetical protein
VEAVLRRTPSAQHFLSEFAVAIVRPVAGGPRPSPLPAAIGRYRVTGTLGEGGMGMVYAAVDDAVARDWRLARTWLLQELDPGAM